MKYLKTIGVLLMLVIFPALSWYYLDKGADYRREINERIQPKEPWNLQEFEALSSIVDWGGKTTVIWNKNADRQVINDYYDQYATSYTFQMAVASDLLNNKDNVISYSSPFSPLVAIIDTSGNVRSYYNESNNDNLNKLIEDTAIVIPRKPSRDIETR